MPRIESSHLEQLIGALDVLVVEDNANMRRVIRSLLEAIGVGSIDLAADGVQGLEAIQTFEPDILILDWEIPMLGGAELVRIVRSGTCPTPDLPIIVLSAHGERQKVLEAMRLGVDQYLIKPISVRAMHARLAAIVTNPRRTVWPAVSPMPVPPPLPDREYWDVSA